MKAQSQAILVLLGLALVPCSAPAEEPDRESIRDSAGLFRASSRTRATQEIDAIRRLCQRDVLVETMASVPAADRNRLKAMRPAEQREYFAALGEQRAEASHLNGVLILFCRDPRHIQITVWPDSQRQAFTDDDAERLHKLLTRRRFWSGLDQALLYGLVLVRDTYSRNLRLKHPDQGPADAVTMAVVVLAFVATWLLLVLASARLGPIFEGERIRQHPGLLGTMFGQAAARWIYDRLFYTVSPTAVTAIPSAAAQGIAPAEQSVAAVAESRVDFETVANKGTIAEKGPVPLI